MIIKCSHCAGKMRIDESRIPEGQKVKIRCPHCKGIGLIQDQPTVDHTPTPEVFAGARSAQERGPTVTRTATNGVSEHTLPSDAFQSFRFPSERGVPVPDPRSPRAGFGIMTWILVSLGVVGFFALLVNIILPGPAR